jgi:hypothetical protein
MIPPLPVLPPQNNYECLGITCAQVGGPWFSATNKYFVGAAPCKDGSNSSLLPVSGIVVIVTALIAILLLILLCAVVRRQRTCRTPHLVLQPIDLRAVCGNRSALQATPLLLPHSGTPAASRRTRVKLRRLAGLPKEGRPSLPVKPNRLSAFMPTVPNMGEVRT